MPGAGSGLPQCGKYNTFGNIIEFKIYNKRISIFKKYSDGNKVVNMLPELLLV